MHLQEGSSMECASIEDRFLCLVVEHKKKYLPPPRAGADPASLQPPWPDRRVPYHPGWAGCPRCGHGGIPDGCWH